MSGLFLNFLCFFSRQSTLFLNLFGSNIYLMLGIWIFPQ